MSIVACGWVAGEGSFPCVVETWRELNARSSFLDWLIASGALHSSGCEPQAAIPADAPGDIFGRDWSPSISDFVFGRLTNERAE